MTYSMKTREVLGLMAKWLPKDPVRAYAGVIGIRNQKASITDGFALLTYESEDFEGVDETLDRMFQKSNVRYPDIEVVRPQGEAWKGPGEDILYLASNWRQPKNDHGLMRVTKDEAVLVRQFRPEDKLSFDPALIGRFLKVIPKGTVLQSATMYDEEMVLEFDGKIKLLVIGVRAGYEHPSTATDSF